MFSDSIVYNLWNSNIKKHDLLNYILPTEDLEDLNLVKKNIKNLENFEFSKIVKKYNLENYIVTIFFIDSVIYFLLLFIDNSRIGVKRQISILLT